MSAAVLSLIEIILAAVCRTDTRVPAGTYCSDPLPGLFSASVTVRSWFQETRPAAIWCASAPRTNSLNIEASGRAAEAATWWTGVQIPPGETRAASRLASGASAARSRSAWAQLRRRLIRPEQQRVDQPGAVDRDVHRQL